MSAARQASAQQPELAEQPASTTSSSSTNTGSSSSTTTNNSTNITGTSSTLGKSNVERRTWDKAEYRKKAQARLAAAEGEGNKEEFFAVAPKGLKGPAGSKRAFLQARKRKVQVDKNLGKFQTISTQATGAAAGGYYCEVCDCTLRDSVTWIDHINGKKHQRKLGFSMRVERSTRKGVADRLSLHKKARDRKEKKSRLDLKTYSATLKKKHEERLAAVRKTREQRRKKKEEEEAAAAAAVTADLDPALVAMMGFGGFGTTSKKKR